MIGSTRERQQRQPPVDAEHHDAHDGQGEEVVHDGQDAAGEHFIDGIHVGREPRNQAPHRMGVEEAHVQLLHVAEDVAAQVEHDLLPDPLHQIGLDEFEQVRRQQRDDVDFGELGNAVPRVGRRGGAPATWCSAPGLPDHVAVDADLDQVGPVTSARDLSVTETDEMIACHQ